ncbi:MAG: branched-chain amino acid ABC transporter permease [Planctomycetota bacterium]|nr:branched-chain amino acid ABC transporter permease [Planctomycetota bacterium]
MSNDMYLSRLKTSFLAAVWILILTFPLAGIGTRETKVVTGEESTIKQELVLRSGPFLLAGVVFACGLLWLGVKPLGRVIHAVSRRARNLSARGGFMIWKRVVLAGLMLAVIVAVLSMPFWGSERAMRKYVDLGVEVWLYVLLALGLNITIGWTGLLVLGYVAFFCIGAYVYAILSIQCGLPFWPGLLVGGLSASIAGILLGIPSLRLRGDYLAIVTLGFGETIRYLMQNLKSVTGGMQGLPNQDISGTIAVPAWISDGPPRSVHYYFLTLTLVVIVVLLLRRLNNSRIGRAWVAIREDEVAAQAMGINTFKLKVLAFALSAFVAGMAGVVFAARIGYFTPDAFKFETSVLVVAMVILGGMGSIPGVIAGAALLWLIPWALRDPIPRFLSTHFPAMENVGIEDYQLAIFGGILVLMMIFRPQGLIPSRRASYEMGLEEEEESR